MFKRVNNDFVFLMKLIKNSKGELDFAIREDYFNLYYKGNSLAKVSFRKDEVYEISIHKAFFSESKAKQDKRFKFVKGQDNSGNYFIGLLPKDLLHPFFQQKYLDDFCSKIKSRNYGEEIVFEQNLITDNINKDNFLFIDRQITDNILKRKRMDLLALKQVEADNFQLLVCEVKLGNNPELKNKVASQLNDYLSHINNNFKDYKACLHSHKTFIVDVYAANVLETLSNFTGLPSPLKGFSNLKVLFLNRLTTNLFKRGFGTMANKFSKAKITKDEISQNPSDYVVLVRPTFSRVLVEVRHGWPPAG